MRGCQHIKLYFGSGGFYISCRDCGATWAADGDRNNKPDRCTSLMVGLGDPDEYRIDPRLPTTTK